MILAAPAVPEAVAELAWRCGASGRERASAVAVSQSGFLRGEPSDALLAFTADQTIQLRESAFVWSARCDPVSMLVLREQLASGRGRQSLLAFGRLPLSGGDEGPEADRAGLIRFLAELPLAPDAMLRNGALRWTPIDGRTFRVATGMGEGRAEVVLRLGDDGLVSSAESPDRPRKEGAVFVPRPWRLRFSGYGEWDGRMIPGRTEASWIVDGEPFDACLSEIEDWRLV
jgi:hypothetical protein